MPRSPTRAVNVTLPADLIEEGKQAVERGEARSFSAWLAARASGERPGAEIRHILDDIEVESAHLDPVERERIDADVRRQLDEAYARWDARNSNASADAA